MSSENLRSSKTFLLNLCPFGVHSLQKKDSLCYKLFCHSAAFSFWLTRTPFAFIAVMVPLHCPPQPNSCDENQKDLQVNFLLAANGDVLATMHVNLPWKFDHKQIRKESGQCLKGLTAIGLADMPCYQYTAPCRDLALKGTPLPIERLSLSRPCFETAPLQALDIFWWPSILPCATYAQNYRSRCSCRLQAPRLAKTTKRVQAIL